MRAQQIIDFAKDLKATWNTDDPYFIAKQFGIVVLTRDTGAKNFRAHTVKTEGYPTFISINNAYSELSQKVLCAHELGHALLHRDCINHFAITPKNVNTNVEYEANLFAVALLIDEFQLNTPLTKLNSYALKSILDCNIYKK